MSDNDPMVPILTLLTAINRASRALSVARVGTGGHMVFPQGLDLGQPNRRGLEPQVTQWLLGNG